jgi:LysR family hydrogen peroxide-inducible transcriptional activator
MELRQLQYVIEIAKEKNVSRAAKNLHIAQPSLSQQLAKLEKELGVLLFQRSTNSVELTHAGAAFVAQAQKIADAVEQLKREMEDIALMRKGKLVVGSLPMTGSHVLPLVLPVFKAAYPDIEVTLIEETSANLEQLAAQGHTDISLLSLPLQDRSLECKPIINEEICLAVPPNHRLAALSAKVPSLELSELKDEPFVLLKKGQGFRHITLDLCASAGFAPQVVFESSNIETVQSLVAAGMGVALVPQMVTRSSGSRLTPVYLRLNPAPTRTLVIAYRKGRYLSKAAEAFIDTMTSVMNKTGMSALGANG